jgi:hypothetical protein
MLNQKKLESHLVSIEAAAKLMLAEAKKVRAMIEEKEVPVKIDITAIKFYQRRQRSLNKKSPCL